MKNKIIAKMAGMVKWLTVLILFFVFAVAPNTAFAQSTNEALFDTSNIIRQEKISASAKTPLAISLLPFTTITFNPGSFKNDVTIFVYQGNFDKIKTALPQGQSPISSYYFTFKSADGAAVLPLLPLRIESYNNYVDTNTFFYPVLSPTEIDKANQQEWPGHIRVRTDLPVNDSGFIVAANKDLKADDQALNVKPGQQEQNVTPAQNNTVTPQTTKTIGVEKNSILQIVAVLSLVILAVISVGLLILWKKQKTRV